MIKRIKERDYLFKSPFGSITVDEVEVGVCAQGRRSLSSAEIERLSHIAALSFWKKNYRKALSDKKYVLSAAMVKAFIVFLNVNQSEFGQLIGCQKSKISKILRNEQKMSRSQTLLAFERLGLELAIPGANHRLLGDFDYAVAEDNVDASKEIKQARLSGAA